MITQYFPASLIDGVCNALLAGKNEITLPRNIGKNDIMPLFKLCISRHPEIIHISNSGIDIYEGFGGLKILTRPKTAWNSVRRQTCRFTTEDSVYLKKYAQSIVNNLHLNSMNEMMKVVTIFDYLSRNISYEEAESAFDAWGALIDKKAVCEGVSYAFCLLTQLCGIEAAVIRGNSHAWNIVKVDGLTYHADITANISNAQHGTFNYNHLFLKDSDISKYSWDRRIYPPCTSNKHNYFIQSDSFATNADKALSIIKRQLSGGKIIYFRLSENIPFNYDVLYDWISRACRETGIFISETEIQLNSELNIAYVRYK